MENTILLKRKDYNKKKIIVSTIIYIFLIFIAILILFPFYWMILTSLKSFGSYNAEVTPQFYTLRPVIDNYKDALVTVNLGKYMFNTVIFAILTTFLMLIVIIPAAFAFARLNFKGKDIVFTIFLSLMMIPSELVIITNYQTIVDLDWRNSFTGLIMPSIMSIFYIYLLKENFALVPDEIYYAAKIDGATDFGYMCKVLVPINLPTVITIIILKLIECWNSFVWPRLITTDAKYFLVSNGIQMLRESGSGRENIPLMMAAVVMVSLPLIILFVIFRKQIMTGVSKSGLKG